MDQYTRWFLITSVSVLLPALALLGPGAWLLARWVRDRKRVLSLLCGLPLVLVGVALAWLFLSARPVVLNRLALARELSVPPPSGFFFDPGYAEVQLVAQITPGVTTRDEVHQVMRLAKAHYDCPTHNAEKYLLYVDHYSNDELGNVPNGIHVYYDGRDIAARVERFGDSTDPIWIDECSPL